MNVLNMCTSLSKVDVQTLVRSFVSEDGEFILVKLVLDTGYLFEDAENAGDVDIASKSSTALETLRSLLLEAIA
jgi:hypothetical protein